MQTGDMMEITSRQYDILEIVKKKGKVSVSELTKILYVSDMTIRRELVRLEEMRLIKRYHGGAICISDSDLPLPTQMRDKLNENEKRKLAAKAEKYIKDDQVIFIDSSSTCSYMSSILKKYKNIRVVTNSVATMLKFSAEGIGCMATGGEYYDVDMCFVGELAIEFISNINFDVAFFSTSHFDKESKLPYDSALLQTAVRRAAIKNSNSNIFLYDNTKQIGKSNYLVCKAEFVTDIIVI